MRCFRTLRARKDIVELLVRQGRLADIQMLNFFSVQLNREIHAAAAAATTTTTTAATAVAAAAIAVAGVTTASAETGEKAAEAATPTAPAEATATPEASTASANATDADAAAAAAATAAAAKAAVAAKKRKAWTAFHDRSNAVQELAGGASPVAWLKEVYGGTEEWSSPALTAATAVATRAVDGAPAQLKASGLATAVGAADAQTAATGMPKSIRVVLRLEGADAAELAGKPTYVTASVALDQSGVVEKKLVNGVLRVRLDKATAVQHESLAAEQVASYEHVLTSTAYSAILRKVEEVCALHATHTVRYDALLLRNPAVQMRLAQLACFRYGINCLTDYVVGDPDVEEDFGHDSMPDPFRGLSERLHMPLMESMSLNIYAERALMDGIDAMWEMVRDTPLVAAVPHRSNPAKTIDYPYLAKLLNSSKYLLTSSNGTMEEQALTFLQPLLAQGGLLSKGADGGITAALQRVAGLTAGHGHGSARLAAAHVNLSGMAQALEQDVAKLLQMLATQQDKAEPNFVIGAAQYISEVLANLAVIYRCTAALNIDEEGRGHREWLLAQAFGGASAMRRQRIVEDLTMARAAAKVIRKSKDLDNYSTHPIELMNASPRKAGAAAASKEPTGDKAASSASA